MLKNGLNFKNKNIKVKFKLIPDLLSVWYLFGNDYGYGNNKKCCPYCDQKCDESFLGPNAGKNIKIE